jgi:hypothetical protein
MSLFYYPAKPLNIDEEEDEEEKTRYFHGMKSNSILK